jgi:hypothetical protein
MRGFGKIIFILGKKSGGVLVMGTFRPVADETKWKGSERK